MTFVRQVSRQLDAEHHANLELLGRVRHAFGGLGSTAPPRDPGLARLAGTLGRQIREDIDHHFAFEEREIFPRMDEAGAGDMVALLTDEHATIGAVAAELIPLSRAAEAGTLDDAGWELLRRHALELDERLSAHIHKETMGLLPLIDYLLSDDDDRELAFVYAAAA